MDSLPTPNHNSGEDQKFSSEIGASSEGGVNPSPEVGVNPSPEVEENKEESKEPASAPVDPQIANKVNVGALPQGKIEVRATRKGFYRQNRRKKGDKFKISKFEDVGDWMVCIDPVMEKKRKQFLVEKKKKAK